jgi:hypothetical protein
MGNACWAFYGVIAFLCRYNQMTKVMPWIRTNKQTDAKNNLERTKELKITK